MWKHNYLICVQVFLQLIEPFLTALTENIATWFLDEQYPEFDLVNE